MISSDRAELLALWVETLLYGMFFAYFQESIGLLTWRRSGPRINWILVCISLSIFALATAHLVIVLCRAQQAFISGHNAVVYFNNLQSGLEVSQASSQVAISVIGDGMVIYRVWVVYNRSYWVLSLPVLSYIGTTVCSITSVVFIGKASSVDTPFYLPDLEIWLPAFFGMTFATSVLCSLLIAGRLWYIHQWIHTSQMTNTLKAVLRIVIESASIYSLTMLLYLATYVSKSNTSIIFGDLVSPVIGIAFSLITIRVHNAFNPDTYNSDFNSSGTDSSQKRPGKLTFARNKNRNRNPNDTGYSNAQYPRGTLTVSVGPLSDPYSVSLGDVAEMPSTGTGTGLERDLEMGTKTQGSS